MGRRIADPAGTLPAGVRVSAVLAVVVMLVLALVGSTVSSTRAAFAGATNAQATFSADVLQPPASVRLAHTCTEVLGNLVAYYIDVAWDPSPTSYATSSTVWRATDPAGPWTALTDVGTATTYRDTALQLSTTYHYAITAHYLSWSSLRSVPASLTTKNTLCL